VRGAPDQLEGGNAWRKTRPTASVLSSYGYCLFGTAAASDSPFKKILLPREPGGRWLVCIQIAGRFAGLGVSPIAVKANWIDPDAKSCQACKDIPGEVRKG